MIGLIWYVWYDTIDMIRLIYELGLSFNYSYFFKYPQVFSHNRLKRNDEISEILTGKLLDKYLIYCLQPFWEWALQLRNVITPPYLKWKSTIWWCCWGTITSGSLKNWVSNSLRVAPVLFQLLWAFFR